MATTQQHTDGKPDGRSPLPQILVFFGVFVALVIAILSGRKVLPPRITPENAANLQEIVRITDHRPSARFIEIAMSPAGDYLASTSTDGDNIYHYVWDLSKNWELVSSWEQDDFKVSNIVFLDSGPATIYITNRLRDLQTHEILQTFDSSMDRFYRLSPNSRWILSRDEASLIVWDIQTGAGHVLMNETDDFRYSVDGGRFSDDGTRIAVFTFDFGCSCHKIAVLSNWEKDIQVTFLGAFDENTMWGGLRFSTDNKFIAVGGFGGILSFFDIDSSQDLLGRPTMGSDNIHLRFSPDGHQIAAWGFGYTWLWDVDEAIKTGVPLLSLQPRRGRGDFGDIVEFSPDSRLFLAGNIEGEILVYDAYPGNLITTLDAHEGAIRDIQLTPDGRMLISAGGDGTLRVWAVTESSTRLIDAIAPTMKQF